jgi:hypothetical protein
VTTSVPASAAGLKVGHAAAASTSCVAQQMDSVCSAHCKMCRDAHPAARLGVC